MIKALFLTEVAKEPISDKQKAPRNGAVALSEFNGILAWAVAQALAANLDEVRARVEEMFGSQPPPEPKPVPPVPLHDALTVFKKWLHMDDTAPVIAVAATVVANLAAGDPVWFLLIGPPSGGKTEILSACLNLNYIVPAATITEAALLSGTAKRERAQNATGGLMRQIGDFGILLAKDFTSVLSQNMDTAKAAMAAMREVFDGRWDRPVGAEGGRVLHWVGKCGFIGGATPSYDRYGAVVNALATATYCCGCPTSTPPNKPKPR